MVHQMKVETCGAYIGATNPYTGQALNHWLPRGNRWGKTYIHTDDEEEEIEEEIDEEIDECAPMSKSEYDYWCNGMGYGR